MKSLPLERQVFQSSHGGSNERTADIFRTIYGSFVKQIFFPSTIAYKPTSQPLHAYFLWFLKPT